MLPRPAARPAADTRPGTPPLWGNLSRSQSLIDFRDFCHFLRGCTPQSHQFRTATAVDTRQDRFLPAQQ